MVNRAAVILRYKKPAVRWINEADPSGSDLVLSQEQVNSDLTVYLISDEDGDGDAAVDRWLQANYDWLFEAELEAWYRDPSLWPEQRTWEVFCEWFDVDWHSMIFDTADEALYDDGF